MWVSYHSSRVELCFRPFCRAFLTWVGCSLWGGMSKVVVEACIMPFRRGKTQYATLSWAEERKNNDNLNSWQVTTTYYVTTMRSIFMFDSWQSILLNNPLPWVLFSIFSGEICRLSEIFVCESVCSRLTLKARDTIRETQSTTCLFSTKNIRWYSKWSGENAFSMISKEVSFIPIFCRCTDKWAMLV